MKFLIDENLPPDLCAVFQRQQLVAHHVNQFKSHKYHRIKDDQLRHLNLFRNYVIVTRDDDFVSSYVSRKVPEQMIFVFGMPQKVQILQRFEECIDQLPGLIELYGFLELSADNIRWPLS